MPQGLLQMNVRNNLERVTLILLCTALSVYLISFAAKHIAAAVLPFVTAWAVAMGLRKPSELLARRARIPQRIASVIVLVVISGLLLYLAFLVGSVLVKEGRDLYARLVGNADTVEGTVEKIGVILKNTVRKIPYIGKSRTVLELCENFDERLVSLTASSAPRIISFVGSLLGGIAKAVPYAALFVLVTLIAAFYFCTDLGKINRAVSLAFPVPARRVLFIVKKELCSVLLGYLRAYSLLILLTFTELLIGLSLIGTEYAFLLSFLISLVDILPILGAGTVLIPWGVARIALGDLRGGCGILVLYLIITVIRQLAEPRIVGGFLGLHPLCTLLAMYTGIKLAGFAGLFLFPVAAIVARNVYRKCSNEKEQSSV